MEKRTRTEYWRDRAACKDLPTEWFFPEIGGEKYFARGKEVCRGCTVRTPCLELAKDFINSGDRYGLFGGLTPNDRKMIRRKSVTEVFIRKIEEGYGRTQR
jgi:WhiB family redox-sensing transcriptional regulator